MKRATWEALGTSVVLQVCDAGALAAARVLVERELAEIDRTCSRFRGDSELMRVNAAGGRPVRVDPLLMEALRVALRAAELTDGDVDPTLGAALELAGYDDDWNLLAPPGEEIASPGPAEIASPGPAPLRPLRIRARVRAGWRTVELDPGRMTIRVPAPIRLDLGATAKALAADRAATAVAQATGVGVLVSLGGDIATCGVAPAGGWRVHVTDDHRSDASAPGQTIVISSGGLATSSTAVRRWSHQGVTRHHIIDPQTQEPVVGTWRTASVAAANCVDANIASTAALVRARDAPAWLQELGLPARLVDQAGRVRTLGDWPAEPGMVTEATL
ncbi:MAG TPA: FAD:protein FMN transferase [Solirubrobacteraceae bacterium]|nr:FAD:protein FMN transferase [Solirubrobacteraceae bacterium]